MRLLRKIAAMAAFCVLVSSSINHVCAQSNDEILVTKRYYGKTLRLLLRDLAYTYSLDLDYNESDLSMDIVPGKNFVDTPLTEVLEHALDGTGLHYKLVGRQLVVRKENVDIEVKEIVYERKQDFKLNGVVKDKYTGEDLPFAQIMIRGTNNGTATNADGHFSLFQVPSDTSVLDVFYVGYEQKAVFLTPELVSKALVIEMITEMRKLEGVTVTAEREDLLEISADNVSTVNMTPKQMEALPSLGERDIFRTFQLLPGVSGSNESSSGLYVRGGTPDQNLILYDGFTVYHQEHLFGMYSAFNSNAIKDVQLLKGGFKSKYGGRLSSVMDIIGKTGNEKEFNIGGDLSLLSFNIFTEIPINNKGSILIAGRKSYKSPLYNKFFDAFNESNEEASQAVQMSGGGMKGRNFGSTDPTSYFYDLNAKVSYRPTEKDLVSLSFFNGQDDLDNSREMNRSRGATTISGGITDLTRWGNWGSSLKWSRKWNKKFYMNHLISISNYYSKRDKSNSRTVTEDGVATEMNRGTLEDNDLKDYSYKMDNEFKTGKNNQLEFGLQLSHYDIDYEYTQNDTVSILGIQNNANLLAFYLQDRWTPWNKFIIMPGIRASFYDMTGKVYLEPRFQLTYKITDRFNLKGAWGKYYQFANRVIREDVMSGSRDFWILSDGENIPVSEAIHYIGGLSYENKNYVFEAEAYYKDLKGLSEYTLRFVPSFVEIEYTNYFYNGTGYSTGIELLAQKKFGNLTGWLGYTWGHVWYNFPVYGEGYFPASHDVTHEFKAVGIYNWKKWTFSATWIYATGKPYTEPIGGYTVTQLDGTSADYIITGTKNGARYPDYHRLDVAATYNFLIGMKSLGSVGFSLFNVYNRNNIWYKEYEVDETGLTETDVNLLGITPNVTVSFRLK